MTLGSVGGQGAVLVLFFLSVSKSSLAFSYGFETFSVIEIMFLFLDRIFFSH